MVFKPKPGKPLDQGTLVDVVTTPYQPTQPKPTVTPTQAAVKTVPPMPKPAIPPTQPTSKPNTEPKPIVTEAPKTQPKPKPTTPNTEPKPVVTEAPKTQPKPKPTTPAATNPVNTNTFTPTAQPVAKRPTSIYHIQALTSPSGRGPESARWVRKGTAKGKRKIITKAMIKKDVRNVKRYAAQLKKAKAKAKKLAARKRLAKAKKKLRVDRRLYAQQHKKGVAKKSITVKTPNTSKTASVTPGNPSFTDQSAGFSSLSVDPTLMNNGVSQPTINAINAVGGDQPQGSQTGGNKLQADNTLQQMANQGAVKSDIAPIPNAPQAPTGNQIQLGN